MAAARQKMIQKRFGGRNSATGGKGTVRRKKKAATRSSGAQSDAKLSAALKKLGATNIPGIEEVNLFKEDGKVIHFVNPKVQASIAANTYIASGPCDTKPLQDLLPGIVSQLGMDNIQQLQSAMAGAGGAGGMPGMGSGMPGMGAGMPGMGSMAGVGDMPSMGGADDDDDDDDVPDLVDGNFEDVAE